MRGLAGGDDNVVELYNSILLLLALELALVLMMNFSIIGDVTLLLAWDDESAAIPASTLLLVRNGIRNSCEFGAMI